MLTVKYLIRQIRTIANRPFFETRWFVIFFRFTKKYSPALLVWDLSQFSLSIKCYEISKKTNNEAFHASLCVFIEKYEKIDRKTAEFAEVQLEMWKKLRTGHL